MGIGRLLGLTLLLSVLACQAGSVRVVSLDFAAASSDGGVPALARTLSQRNADILFLRRVPKGAVCGQLAEALKPAGYRLLIESSFRSALTSVEGRRQMAVFARHRALLTRSETWRFSDQAVQPGGCMMAVIQTSRGRVGLFGVQLDDRLARAVTGPQNASTAQVQGGYAKQWVRIIDACMQSPTNSPQAAIITGEFTVAAEGVTADVAKTLGSPGAQRFLKNFLRAPLDETVELSAPSASNAASGRLLLSTNSLPGVVIEGALSECVLELLDASDPEDVGQEEEEPMETDVPVFTPQNFISNQELFPEPRVFKWSEPTTPQTRPASNTNHSETPSGATSRSNAVAKPPAAPLPPQPTNTEGAAQQPSRTSLSNAAARPPGRMPGSAAGRMPVGAVGAGVVLLAGGLGIWMLLRRRAAQVPPLAVAKPENSAWKERALAAEHKAAQAQAVVRAGLLPHLTLWLKQKLVRKLIADRAELLQTHEEAAHKAVAVQQKLTSIEQRVGDQRAAYEEKIQALTRELESAREENRELLRAQIARIQADMQAAAGTAPPQ